MKEINFDEPIEYVLAGKIYPAKLIYIPKINNLNKYIVAIVFDNNEVIGQVDEYGECFCAGKIRNVEKKPEPKFDPRKPVKFAKEGSKSNPIFIKEIEHPTFKYVFEFYSGNEIFVEVFTGNGYKSYIREASKFEKSFNDLVNYETGDK